MAVSIVGVTTNNSGVNSQASVSAAPDAAAAAGDLALIVCANDRGSVAPVVTAATAGYTTGYAIASTNLGAEMGWKRLTSSDLGQNFTATYSTARRAAIAVVVLRGADDPVFTNGALTSSATTHTGPSATPAVNNSMLIGLNALALVQAPFARTFAASGTGWSEDAEDISTNAGSNAVVEVAHRLLSGGAAVSQSGVVLTPSDTSTALVSYRSTVVVAPAANILPTQTISANQTAAAASSVTVSTVASDSDGTIASYAWTGTRYTVGAAPAAISITTGSTTNSITYTSGAVGSLDVLSCLVTDNSGGTNTATTEVRVPTTGELLPLWGYGGTGTSVTNTGGAGSEERALSDGTSGSPTTSTYLLFGAASGTAVERRYRLCPSTARSSIVWTVSSAIDVAGTFTEKIRVYEGNTQRWESTLTTPTTSFANATATMDSTACAAVGDWCNLYVAGVQST